MNTGKGETCKYYDIDTFLPLVYKCVNILRENRKQVNKIEQSKNSQLRFMYLIFDLSLY